MSQIIQTGQRLMVSLNDYFDFTNSQHTYAHIPGNVLLLFNCVTVTVYTVLSGFI